MTKDTRVTADNYPEHGTGTVAQIDGNWATVQFATGAVVAGIHVEDLTPVTRLCQARRAG